jgi:cytoskeletal protein RodZ
MTAGHFSKETVGEYLRREREARRVTLEEISESTRISRPYLEALERNDFRFFSRPEYIRGFLQGYARYLGLNPGEVLKRYEFQQDLARLKGNFHQLPLFSAPGEAAGSEEKIASSSPRPAAGKVKLPISRSILIQIVVLVAALSLSFYLYLALKKLDSGSSHRMEETASAQAVKKEAKGGNESPVSRGNPEKARDGGPAAWATGAQTPGVAAQKGISEKGPGGVSKKRVIGNPESKTYYLPGMKNYEKANKGKKVEFDTEEEAVRKGYKRALP